MMSRSMHGLRSMRFMQLLFFSMAALLAQAIFSDSWLISLVMNLLYLNATLVALSASGTPRRVRHALVVLWVVAFGMRLYAPPELEETFHIVSRCLGMTLLFLCIVSMSRHMFSDRQVTADTLFAAVVIYVLVAILFAQLYSIVYALLPGSFAYPPELALEHGRLRDLNFNYFSFVTIATLGYGDIAPRHAAVQMLASIEAVVGQFYVAIVVARLVGLYAGAPPTRPE